MPRLLPSWTLEEDRLLKSLILQRVTRGASVREACLQFSLDMQGAHSALASYMRWQLKLASTCRAEFYRARQLGLRAHPPVMAERTWTSLDRGPDTSSDYGTDQLLENVIALVDASKKTDVTVQELRSALDAANANIEILEQERTQLTEYLTDRERVVGDLNAHIYALDDTCRSVEEQLDAVRATSAREISDLRTQLADTTARYEQTMLDYGELRMSSQNEIQTLQMALSEWQGKHNERLLSHKQELEAAHAERSSLRSQLTEIASRQTREQASWSERFSEEQVEIKRLQDELFASKEEHLRQVASLQQTFAAERATLTAAAEEESHAADKRLQESQLAARQLITSLEEVRARYAEQTNTAETLRQKLTDVRDQYAQVMEEYAQIRAKDAIERAALSSRVQELEHQAELAKRASDTGLVQVNQKYEETRAQLQTLQDKHRRIVEEYGQFRAESERQTATLFKEVWDAMVRNNELLAEYAKVREENTRLIQNVADFSRQVTSAFSLSPGRESSAAIPTSVESPTAAPVRKLDLAEESEFAKARLQRLTGKE